MSFTFNTIGLGYNILDTAAPRRLASNIRRRKAALTMMNHMIKLDQSLSRRLKSFSKKYTCKASIKGSPSPLYSKSARLLLFLDP